jgi:hypothetical protein
MRLFNILCVIVLMFILGCASNNVIVSDQNASQSNNNGTVYIGGL